MWNWPLPSEVLNGPADVSPDGIYNFDERPPYNNLAYALVAVCITLTILGASLRAYTRLCVVKKVHVEDYLALFALVPYFLFIWGLVGYVAEGGLFVHQWNIRVGNMMDLGVAKFLHTALANLVTQYLYVFTVIDAFYVIPAKAAILLEWIRIFVPRKTRNWFYWAAWSIIAINSLFYFAALLVVIFAEWPIEYNWNLLVPGGRSLADRKLLDLIATGVNLFTDISTFLLPQRIIWSLKMTRSRKIGISSMFSFGVFSVALAVGRLVATANAIYPWPVLGDTAYTISPLWLWYLGELTSVNIVLVLLSVPRAFSVNTMPGRILGKVLSWTSVLRSSSRTTASKTWSSTTGSAPSSHMHRLTDDDSQATGLTDLKTMQGLQDGNILDTTSTRFSHSNGIVKTIVVDQEAATTSDISFGSTNQHQHPWMDYV
ncbi:hypothetical protein E0Z10_g8482 [Xylaria hypoxylon]|uniref:Rhodopsin domain-containing protein n=1 Tax=Xylaria hypoxylon TaxID=37992 RepID=A0A4Z0Y808_9PEZI|nr:hypothetical protein E0Z10_g8482 [Xylaria hypoxylon]